MVELSLVGTEIPFLVANVLAFVLGIVLLVLQGSRRPARVFGLYLMLRSIADAAIGLATMAWVADDLAGQYAFLRLRILGLLATPFLLIALAANYPRPRGVFSRPAGLVGLGLGALSSWIFYLVRPESVEHLVLLSSSWQAIDLGPLAVLLIASAVLEAGLAVWYLWILPREPPGARRRVVGVFVLGFGAQAVYYGAQAPSGLWSMLQGARFGGAFDLFQVALLLGTFLPLVAFAVLGVVVVRQLGWSTPILVLLVPLAGAVTMSLGYGSVGIWLQGLSWLILPAFATYALLRHTLFDLDLRLRWTIQQGTIASVFLAVFFVVSAGASEFLIDQFGYTMGAVAVGLMFFVMRPVQAFAERVAKQAVPQGKPLDDLLLAERLGLYRDQVELAWQDGTIGTKERSILRNLRDRLNIDLADAARIEDEVTGA